MSYIVILMIMSFQTRDKLMFMVKFPSKIKPKRNIKVNS